MRHCPDLASAPGGIARRPALSSLWPQSLRRLDTVSGDAIAPRLRLHPRTNPHHIFKQIPTRNAAEEHPEVAATIAVSMFSPAVTAAAPRNLLVIDGDWEGFLKAEGLRAVGKHRSAGDQQQLPARRYEP
jgi:hypothetical protein